VVLSAKDGGFKRPYVYEPAKPLGQCKTGGVRGLTQEYSGGHPRQMESPLQASPAGEVEQRN
jgi:hypothetical protein